MKNMKAYEYETQQERIKTDELLESYYPVVRSVGLHLRSKLPPQFELDDLLQVGMLGLLQAIENFDESHGASFETYARIRIRGAMLDEVRRSGWTSRSMQQKNRAVSQAIKTAEMRLGREATDAEIAAEMNIGLQEYHQMAGELVSSRLVSYEDQSDDLENNQTSPSPFDAIETDEFQHCLQEVIEGLPEKEKLVMSLYYTNELNLREIGMILEVSESRVCQIHGQALARIRSRMHEWVD